ncbi:MAG: aldolase/citrate lyase family protein [Candidatus Pacearchaeota archaeon]|jgi:citrate lyase beta subunit
MEIQTYNPDEQGKATSAIFSGKGSSMASKLMYNETDDLFTKILKESIMQINSKSPTSPNLVPNISCTLADFGSYKGELLEDIKSKLAHLSVCKLKTIAVDRLSESIAQNPADEKIVGNLNSIPLADKSVDFAIARYIMVWNPKETQKQILKEMSRVTKNYVILQHCGPTKADAKIARKRLNRLFYGNEVPKLKRTSNCYFSTKEEIESWMNNQGIVFERVQNRIIKGYSDSFVERFNLSQKELKKTKDILGDKDRLEQTTWVIYHPQNNTELSKIKIIKSIIVVPSIKLEKKFEQKLNNFDVESILFDLEDSVADNKKEEGRAKITSFLKSSKINKILGIRINHKSTPFYELDWKTVSEILPEFVCLVKVGDAEEIKDAEKRIEQIKEKTGKDLYLMVAIETIKGYVNRDSILSCSDKVILFTVGYEDISADLGIIRPEIYENNPLNKILIDCLISAKINNVRMIDAVSRLFNKTHLNGLRKETKYGKSIGLCGKIAIHPNQLKIINEVYNNEKNIKKARQLLEKFAKLKDGSAVIVNEKGEMEDTPSIKLANKIIEKSST